MPSDGQPRNLSSRSRHCRETHFKSAIPLAEQAEVRPRCLRPEMTPQSSKVKLLHRSLFQNPNRARWILAKAKDELTFSQLRELVASIAPLNHRFHRFVSSGPFPKAYREIRRATERIYTTKFAREAAWQCSVFCAYAAELNLFIKVRDSIDHAIAAGNLAVATTLLESVNTTLGHSIWTIQKSLFLEDLRTGLDGNKALLDTIIGDNSANAVTILLSYYLSLRAEWNVSFETYKATIEKELGTKGASRSFRRYIRLHCNPADAEPIAATASDILFFESDSPIVDRYNTFLLTLSRLVAEERATALQAADFVEQLAQYIPDTRLKVIVASLTGHEPRSEDLLSMEYLSLFDSYTVGDYEGSEMQAIALMEKYPAYLESYEIYLRSRAHRQLPFQTLGLRNTVKNRLTEALYHLLSRDEAQKPASDVLLKLALLFGDSPLAFSLQRVVARQTSSHPSRNLERLSFLYSDYFNPQVWRASEDKLIGDQYLAQLGVVYPASATVRFYKEQSSTLLTASLPAFDNAIPPPRQILYHAEALVRAEKYEKAVELLDAGIAVPPILPDYVFRDRARQLLFASNLAIPNLQRCIAIALDAFRDSASFASTLPLAGLCKQINVIRSGEILRDIKVPVLYSYFFSDVRPIYTAYDNFLRAHGMKRPSELFERASNFDRADFIAFLWKVCVPSVMSRSFRFKGTEDLNSERLRICQYLAEQDPSRLRDYFAEINQITEKLVIRRGIKQIHESKIYVDENGIRQAGESYARETFARLQEYKRISTVRIWRVPATGELLLLGVGKSGEVIADRLARSGMAVEQHQLPSDPLEALFREWFLDLRDRFISSKAHGLNSYLSVRIRHGTLEGQIRSPFEAYHLISQKDTPEGAYSPNEFWDEKLRGLPASKRSKIQTHLAELSAKVDGITGDLKVNLIQVKTEQKARSGLFDYEFTVDELNALFHDRFESTSTYESFVDEGFRVLWERTNTNLTAIRERMSGPVVDALYEALTVLHDETRSDVGPLGAPELLNAIKSCQTEVQNECATIARWFSVTASRLIGEFKISDIIQISVASVGNFYPTRNIAPAVELEATEVFDGKFFTQFSDIFRTLLQNSIVHSGLAPEDSDIKISVKSHSGDLDVEFSNLISEDKLALDPRGRILKYWGSTDLNEPADDITSEGGTGIIKVRKLLTIDLGRTSPAIHCEYRSGNTLAIKLSFNADGLTI
jgi:hypothetical protein